jgi:hypothetical protein
MTVNGILITDLLAATGANKNHPAPTIRLKK